VLDITSTDSHTIAWENFVSSFDAAMGNEGNDYFRFFELPILKKLIFRSGDAII
jgi:hypothetical protein